MDHCGEKLMINCISHGIALGLKERKETGESIYCDMRPGRWESRTRRDSHWQQLDKHMSAATDMYATTDKWCFLCFLCSL
jgi:hypothetical protein